MRHKGLPLVRPRRDGQDRTRPGYFDPVIQPQSILIDLANYNTMAITYEYVEHC